MDDTTDDTKLSPARARDRGVAKPCAALLGLQPIGVLLLVFELQRIGGEQVLIPRLKSTLIKHLLYALPGRNIKVIFAFRTNTKTFVSLFLENGRGATRALHP